MILPVASHAGTGEMTAPSRSFARLGLTRPENGFVRRRMLLIAMENRVRANVRDRCDGLSRARWTEHIPFRLVILITALGTILSASEAMLVAQEPFGAEDKGVQDRGTEGQSPSIPEPMVFDLVRSLGAKRGELEINVLGEFPLVGSSGPGARGEGLGGENDLDWAPEIEYALWDGFAIEFELPMENSRLVAWKMAAQWTIPRQPSPSFIDGFQLIVEPDRRFEQWELAFLYLAGIQFDRNWSTLAMLGVRPEIESGEGTQHVDGLFNMTLFRDVDYSTTLGLESDLTFGERDRMEWLLIPQIDREITDHWELQFGGGCRLRNGEAGPEMAARLIYSR